MKESLISNVIWQCPVADWSLWSTAKTIDFDNTWCCETGLFGIVVPLKQNGTGLSCKAYGESLKDPEATASSISVSPCTDSVSSSTTASDSTSASNPTGASNSTIQISEPSPGNKKLSVGAISGIAVGAVVGALAVIVGGLILWRNRKKDTTEGPTGAQENVQYAMVAQMDGHEIPQYKQSSMSQYSELDANQLDGKAMHELGLGQTNAVHELGAGQLQTR